MTVSESIIEWLLTFNPSSFWQMDAINTDLQSAVTTSYALTKEPTIKEKHYLSGKVERTEYYQLSARLDTQTNSDRKDNVAWLEALDSWVAEQNKSKIFPNMTGATVSEIWISSSFYMGQTAEDNSIYSLTLAIRYTK